MNRLLTLLLAASCLTAVGRDYQTGSFWGAGNTSYWWTSTTVDDAAWFQDLNAAYNSLGHSENSKNLGFSVRCVRDIE